VYGFEVIEIQRKEQEKLYHLKISASIFSFVWLIIQMLYLLKMTEVYSSTSKSNSYGEYQMEISNKMF